MENMVSCLSLQNYLTYARTAPRSPGKKILLHGGKVGKKPILSFFTGTAPRSPGKKILLHGGTVGKKPILGF